MAFQCPECALRFLLEAEVDDHLRLDHPDFHIEPKSDEDAYLMEVHRKHHAPTPHTDR